METTRNGLREAAEADAASFALPENWRKDRTRRDGLAIDAAYSRDIDDAISLSETPSGQTTLHVSIADVGTFVPSGQAIARYARRRVSTIYRDERAALPMIPRPISEDRLSLLHDVERPVLTVHVPISPGQRTALPEISRDIIRTKRIDFNLAEEESSERTELGIALRGLKHAAKILFIQRHGGDVAGNIFDDLDDEEGNLLSPGFGVGMFIVQECMIAANAAMARFMQANNVPALYRNHAAPHATACAIANATNADERFARANYDVTARGHFPLGLSEYTHFTSPLRRFPDFANHANIAAFLDDAPFPYRKSTLRDVAKRIEMLTEKERAQEAREVKRAPRMASPYRRVEYLLNKFANGTIRNGEVVAAIFNAVGTESGLAAVRELAARHVADNLLSAKSLLAIAHVKKFVDIRPSTEDDKVSAKDLIEDGQGNVYPYTSKHSVIQCNLSAARALIKIAGSDIEPIIPERKRRKKTQDEKCQLLQNLEQQRRLRMLSQSTAREDGSMAVTLTALILGHSSHVVTAVGESREKAFELARARMVEELDLVNDMPPALPDVPPDTLTAFNVWKLKNKGTLDCIYLDVPVENGYFICEAIATDSDDAKYIQQGFGFTKADARRQAIAALMRVVPPVQRKSVQPSAPAHP